MKSIISGNEYRIISGSFSFPPSADSPGQNKKSNQLSKKKMKGKSGSATQGKRRRGNESKRRVRTPDAMTSWRTFKGKHFDKNSFPPL